MDPSPRPASSCTALLLRAYLEGVRLSVREPQVRRAVLGALALNTLLFLLLCAALAWAGWHGARWALAHAGLPEGLAWLVLAAGALGLALVAPVLYQATAAVVLAPWRERIFRRARALCGMPQAPPPAGLAPALRVVSTELRRLLRLLLWSLALLPLNLVPVVGSLAYMLAQWLLSAHSLAWDLLSFHFESHDLPYAAQRRLLRRHRPAALALGSLALALVLLPIVQLWFLAANAAVAGAISARIERSARCGSEGA